MSRPRDEDAVFWVAEREEEAIVQMFQNANIQMIQNENFQRFQTGLLCFPASASASVYKDHDEAADTRTVDHVHRRVSGAPFDGSSFDAVGTPFDGTPFDKIGHTF